MTEVITLGECLVAFVASAPGPLAEAATFERFVAGAEANVAVGLARLGHSVAFVGRVGDDGFGEAIRRRLRGEGVSVDHLGADAEATTGVMFRERRGIGPAQVVYARRGSAGSRLTPTDVDRAVASGLLQGGRWLHLTGITPGLSPVARAASEHAASLARGAGLTVSLDLNLRRRVWSEADAAPVLRGLAGAADVLLGSPDELALVTGRSADDDPADVARSALALGPSLVVAKLGAGGAVAVGGADPGDSVARPALPLALVVDPVGAGDAFCAGFIAARLDGADPATALEMANACGASAAAALGDQTGLPDRNELAALLGDERWAGHDPVTDAFEPEAFEPDALVEALAEVHPGARDRLAQGSRSRGLDARVVRAPGRVNLIGEHTDYNGGFVLPAAIDLEIRIAYVGTDDRRVDLVRLETGERDGFDLDTPRGKTGSWLDYVAGTAWALDEAGLPLRGLAGVIASSLPPNAGLSSSAAIELASAWAMLDDAAPGVDRFRLAQICQRAENAYVGVQSGLMDQFAESCGVVDSALLLDCRSSEWRAIPLPSDVAMVVCHTGSPRHLGRSEYNFRRSQCEAAVAALARDDPAVRSLRDVTPEALAASAGRLDPVAYRRAEHIVSENARVGAAVDALAAGDLPAVGRLFAASHASLRDLFEVSSPELDVMVEIASGVPGVIAARMTGAGFGGCTVNLVRPDAIAAMRLAVETHYPARTGLKPMVLPVRATAGAGRMA